jgi:hypothetical protein
LLLTKKCKAKPMAQQEDNLRGFEYTKLRGWTIKNTLGFVIGIASVITSVEVSYFGLKQAIQEVKYTQDLNYRILDLRLKTLEDKQTIMRQELDQLKLDAVNKQVK